MTRKIIIFLTKIICCMNLMNKSAVAQEQTTTPTVYPTIKPILVQTSETNSSSGSKFKIKWSTSLESLTNASNLLISSSRNGNYLAAVSVNGESGEPIYYSNNSGRSWNEITIISSSTGGWGSIYMSANGKVLVLSTVSTCGPEYSKVYVSINYGLSFTLGYGLPDNCNGFWKVSLSYNGQYMYATLFQMYGSNLYKSINYGMNWTKTERYSANSIVSDDGRDIVDTFTHSSIVSISNDYGGNWTSKNIFSFYSYSIGSYNPIVGSTDLQYILIGIDKQQISSSVSPSKVVIITSTDYGASFKMSLELEADLISIQTMSMSSSGKYAIILNNNKFYLSVNYGVNWTTTITNPTYYSVSIINNVNSYLGISLIVGTTVGIVLFGQLEDSDCPISYGPLVIMNGTIAIDSYKYENCDTITSVYIPSTVKSIGENAFIGCSLITSIRFQEGLKLTEKNVNNFLLSLNKNNIHYKTVTNEL